MFLPFPYLERLLSSLRAAELFGRHPVLLPAFDGEHVNDHLPRYGERCSVGVAFFQFLGHGSSLALVTLESQASLPRSARAGYACSSAWRSASALSCPPNSSHLRKVRSS